jgi:hypothetical protein
LCTIFCLSKEALSMQSSPRLFLLYSDSSRHFSKASQGFKVTYLYMSVDEEKSDHQYQHSRKHCVAFFTGHNETFGFNLFLLPCCSPRHSLCDRNGLNTTVSCWALYLCEGWYPTRVSMGNLRNSLASLRRYCMSIFCRLFPSYYHRHSCRCTSSYR